MSKAVSLSILLSLAALVVALFLRQPVSSGGTLQDAAFERVARTNTLRCGYAIATPWFFIDPTTGEKKGYDYDMTMAVAEKMGVKVDWVEETGWGIAEQGLMTGRYDMLCGAVCIDPKRNRAAIYSTPIKHSPVLPIARQGDTRFDNGPASINDPSVRIGVKSGHVFEYIAKEMYTKATLVYANDISDDTDFLLMLTSNKVDIAMSGKVTADLYEKENPGKIHVLPYPARYCDGAFMLPLGSFNLKQMVDNAILELNTSGRMKDIAQRYVPLDPLYNSLPASPIGR